jgi:hypothetical protein
MESPQKRSFRVKLHQAVRIFEERNTWHECLTLLRTDSDCGVCNLTWKWFVLDKVLWPLTDVFQLKIRCSEV